MTTTDTYRGRTVETDASTFTAQTVAAEVTNHQHGVSQSGRYGVEIILPTHADAKAVAKALRSGGHRARIA